MGINIASIGGFATSLFNSWKFYLLIGLVAGGAWWIKARETAAYEEGVASGKNSGWNEAAAHNKAIWDIRTKLLNDNAERLDVIATQLQTRRSELQRAIQSNSAVLNQTLAQINTRTLEDQRNAANVPASVLPAYIRSALRQLRAIESERAARPLGPIAN